MAANQPDLKEKTNLPDRFFPLNIFTATAADDIILGIHWHEHVEILFVTQGQAMFYLGDKGFESEAGDILIVNSGRLHSGYAINNTKVSYEAIVFDKALMGSSTPDPNHARYILPFLDGRKFFPEKISKCDRGYCEIKRYLDLLLSEFTQKQEGYELAVKAALQLLLLAIHRSYDEKSTKTTNWLDVITNIEHFKLLMTYIDANYSVRLTVNEAARIVSLSPNHFCKTFKKLTGRTFVEFLNLYRINKAAELLQGTNLPIGQIAAQVGFCNINYFDKVFKLCKQCSPMQCRKVERGAVPTE